MSQRVKDLLEDLGDPLLLLEHASTPRTPLREVKQCSGMVEAGIVGGHTTVGAARKASWL